MHWHLLGLGALGTLWADRLLTAGLQVSAITRSADISTQVERRLHWQGEGKTLQLPRFNPEHTAPTQTPLITHLLVVTKSYDTLSAFDSVATWLSPEAEVVFLHNGIGPQLEIAQRRPDLNLWVGTTTAAAYRDPEGEVYGISLGETELARWPGGSLALPASWDKVVPPITPSDQPLRVLWKKLAINAVINPMTALLQCRNGELLSTDTRRQQLQQLCSEIEKLAQALDIPLFSEPLYTCVCRVAQATAGNYSSMCMDTRLNQTTEIEAITGYVCRQAQALGLVLPGHQALWEALQR
ncbi:ketopantoate reductase family protein [Nitrincola tapanii]|uniref:2-dehydropantoate 2-reductase n=1 Tax=Nitrincola tapanii TaxID=1708751 RepID=A0A5A9W3F3_9GAMM|nr:2-dehydropantoate 2-reductase [Nitrincola tapanii]KAA0874081.1 2-dehydropantoate 2-reductase [Nitrincola tapanii]